MPSHGERPSHSVQRRANLNTIAAEGGAEDVYTVADKQLGCPHPRLGMNAQLKRAETE